MYYYMPEISWHDRGAIMAIDFHHSTDEYKLVTSSIQQEVRIWTFSFERADENSKPALAVNFVANLAGYHRSAVNLVRFSPIGDLLASGDSDGVMVVWQLGESTPSELFSSTDEMPSNKENWIRMRSLSHERDICYLTWSPDSQMIASSSIDDTVSVHLVKTGKRLWCHRHFRRVPNGLAWDPRGKYLVVLSAERKMDILDAVKGTRLRQVSTVQFPDTRLSTTITLPAGKYKLFHDDQLMSFVRSADFSPDGQHLFVPSGHLEIGKNNVYTSYVFARSDMDRPIAILPSNSPTFIARCCPIAFELRSDSTEKFIDLPYRLVWAMVSNNAITLFDSQHSMPFAYMDNIHYNSITDLQWSSNGRVMLIASLEGYCSFILFGEDEIGIPLQPVLPVPPASPSLPMSAAKKTPRRSKNIPPSDASNQRLTPSTTTINSSPGNTLLRYLRKTPTMETAEECVPVKKNKKRIQLITLTE